MTQANEAGARPPATVPRWPRVLLLFAAAIELLSGLSDLPILFGDLSDVPGPGFGGAIVALKIALQPILALAALMLTIRGRMTHALFAMAAIILLTWLSFLPSVVLHGLEAAGIAGVFTLYQIILAPVIAAAVAVLAAQGTRPVLATLLAVLPTLIDIAGVVAFAVGVAISGF